MYFDDLIFYDMDDTYEKLYLKVHAAFQWQNTFCSEAKWTLKIDDDTVIDLNDFLYWMKIKCFNSKKHSLVFGNVQYGVEVRRDKFFIYHVPYADYPLSQYPPYMSGPSYLLSSQAVSAIMLTTNRLM
uniref:Hexosyltransferase n=1 Tax=Ditylenchus dipsaci TaxID=166011 RepID=A0A915EWG4_9BILA